MSKEVKLYLLDHDPESVTLFKWLLSYVRNKKIHPICMTTNVFASHGGTPNPFIGRLFSLTEHHVTGDMESLGKMYWNDIENKHAIGVSLSRYTSIDSPFLICVDEVATTEDTGTLLLRHEVGNFNVDKVHYDIEESLSKVDLAAKKSRPGPVKKGAISRKKRTPIVTPAKAAIPRVYFVPAEGLAASPPGSGIGNMCNDFLNMLLRACASKGYGVSVASENYLRNIRPRSEDRIICMSMNNIFKGGLATQGQGMNMSNLLHLSGMKTGKAPIVVTTLHPGEAKMYGQPSPEQIEKLKRIIATCYTPDGIRYLESVGFNTTGEPWPISINTDRLSYLNKVSTQLAGGKNRRQILFQFDAQHRKNGEYILPAIIDASLRATKENPELDIEIVAKASAPHAIASEVVLTNIVRSVGLQYPDVAHNIRIRYEGRTSDDEWQNTILQSDLGVFLSTEEGLHMFVAESWLCGMTCIIPVEGPYPKYKDMGNEGVITVPAYPVPSGGTGVYNDHFDTTTKFPSYSASVDAIHNELLKERPERKRRVVQRDSQVITEPVRLTKLLGLDNVGEEMSPKKVPIQVLDSRCRSWLNIT